MSLLSSSGLNNTPGIYQEYLNSIYHLVVPCHQLEGATKGSAAAVQHLSVDHTQFSCLPQASPTGLSSVGRWCVCVCVTQPMMAELCWEADAFPQGQGSTPEDVLSSSWSLCGSFCVLRPLGCCSALKIYSNFLIISHT